MSELKTDWDGYITKVDTIFAIERLKYSSKENKGAVYNSAILDAKGVIANLPEAIVRCKDCKHYVAEVKYCDKWGDMFDYWEECEYVDPNGYCHMGERKE